MAEAEKTQEEWLEAVRQGEDDLSTVPEEMKTPEICMAAVENDWEDLNYVPEAMKTRDVCMAAVRQNGYALEFVPESVMDEEMCLEAVMDEGDVLGQVPDRLKTKRVCMAAWNNENFCELTFMPPDMITQEMAMDFVGRYPGMLADFPDRLKTWRLCLEAAVLEPECIEDVPEEILDAAFVANVVENIGSRLGRRSRKADAAFDEQSTLLFEHIPEDMRRAAALRMQDAALWSAGRGYSGIPRRVPRIARDEDFNARILEIQGREIAELDKDELTEKVCRAALKNWPGGLEKIPAKFRTADVCLDCVRRDPGTLKAVPAKLKTEELCLEAVKRIGMALQFVPEKRKTEAVCIVAAKAASTRIYDFIPEALHSKAAAARRDMREEDFLANVRLWGPLLEYVPEEMRTPEICMEAVRQNGMALAWIPERKRTPELCLEAVRSSPAALQFVPEALQTVDLCVEAASRVRFRSDRMEFVPYDLVEAVVQKLDELEEMKAGEAKQETEENAPAV